MTYYAGLNKSQSRKLVWVTVIYFAFYIGWLYFKPPPAPRWAAPLRPQGMDAVTDAVWYRNIFPDFSG